MDESAPGYRKKGMRIDRPGDYVVTDEL